MRDSRHKICFRRILVEKNLLSKDHKVFGLKDAGKGSKNDLEVAKMLDFEFFRVPGTQRSIFRPFQKIFFAIFFT
jgi:hypothetical protein